MNGFGDVVPALTSLEVCLPEALPDDLLEGKRAGGRNAFTAFHTRGVRVVVTFSPKLGTRELIGEPTWRCWPADSAHWYSIGLLRPWVSESLPPDECERRITAHFEAGAHREYREPNKTDPRRWQFDDGSAVPLGGKATLQGSAAWRIWGLRGYWLLPDGGARDRDGSLVPEASLAQIAKEELLPWPGAALDWRPSEADAECWFRPLDQDTTAALLRLQVGLRAQPARPQGRGPQGRQGRQGEQGGGRKTDTRVGRVVWHLAPTGPRAMVVVGHAQWGGGTVTDCTVQERAAAQGAADGGRARGDLRRAAPSSRGGAADCRRPRARLARPRLQRAARRGVVPAEPAAERPSSGRRDRRFAVRLGCGCQAPAARHR